MNKFIKILNKYIILIIIQSLFGMPWHHIRSLLTKTYNYCPNPDSINYIDYIPSAVNFLIRIISIMLLIIDFKKYKLRGVIFACIAALFFPLLGVVIFAVLLLLEEKKE